MKPSPLWASMVESPADCLSNICFPFYLLVDSYFILGNNANSILPSLIVDECSQYYGCRSCLIELTEEYFKNNAKR